MKNISIQWFEKVLPLIEAATSDIEFPYPGVYMWTLNLGKRDRIIYVGSVCRRSKRSSRVIAHRLREYARAYQNPNSKDHYAIDVSGCRGDIYDYISRGRLPDTMRQNLILEGGKKRDDRDFKIRKTFAERVKIVQGRIVDGDRQTITDGTRIHWVEHSFQQVLIREFRIDPLDSGSSFVGGNPGNAFGNLFDCLVAVRRVRHLEMLLEQ